MGYRIKETLLLHFFNNTDGNLLDMKYVNECFMNLLPICKKNMQVYYSQVTLHSIHLNVTHMTLLVIQLEVLQNNWTYFAVNNVNIKVQTLTHNPLEYIVLLLSIIVSMTNMYVSLIFFFLSFQLSIPKDICAPCASLDDVPLRKKIMIYVSMFNFLL